MAISKVATTAGIGAAIVVGSMLAVTAVSAHSGRNFSEADQTERITSVAEREGITETEAEAFIEERQADRQAERAEARAERLTTLVEEGTLTQEQADALTALKDSAKAEITELKDSGADREAIKALAEENRSEIQAWAESEGLSLDESKPQRNDDEGRKGRHSSDGTDSTTDESTDEVEADAEVDTTSVEV